MNQLINRSIDPNKSSQSLRPGSYVAFLLCRMQFKQKIMKQIISLSIVSIALDTAEMRRMNRGLVAQKQLKNLATLSEEHY